MHAQDMNGIYGHMLYVLCAIYGIIIIYIYIATMLMLFQLHIAGDLSEAERPSNGLSGARKALFEACFLSWKA